MSGITVDELDVVERAGPRQPQDLGNLHRLGERCCFAYSIFSGDGARRVAGRWHRRGQPVIYAFEHYSTAMLERLVHYSGAMPAGQHFIAITIPVGVTYEVATEHSVPGWERNDKRAARAFGAQWIDERRSAILLVPNVVARMESNVLINPAHPQAAQITPGLEHPIWWDSRLFF